MTAYERMALELQFARESIGKTQKDAADYLGCTYQAISNWERGKTKIDSVSLLRLLLFYEVDIYDFMEKCGFEEMHRIKCSAPEFNDVLISAYSNADIGIQESVRKLLDIPDNVATCSTQNFTDDTPKAI